MSVFAESEIEQIALARDPKGFFRYRSLCRAKESSITGRKSGRENL